MDDPSPDPSSDGPPPWPFVRRADLDHRPVWSLFEYRLPADGAAARAALRRELADLHAVPLKQATWAVPEPIERPGRVAGLRDRVVDAGGSATVRPVGVQGEDIALQAALNRACERLWDPVAMAADEQLPPQPGGATHPPQRVLDALGDLRARFAAARADDIAPSDAGHVLGRRLDHLATLLDPGPAPVARVEATLVACWRLRGGDVAWVAALRPLPDPRWDLAFDRFEAFAYRPSDERVPLRHGTFQGACAPDAIGAVVPALEQRIARFRQAHG